MKKIMFAGLLLAAVTEARAQTMATSTAWENDNPRAATKIQQDNEFANTEINVEGRKLSFSDLPDLKKPTWAIITDAAGTQMTQKRVTPQDSGMDLRHLPKGEMYFLTLVYKNKSQKAFVLHL